MQLFYKIGLNIVSKPKTLPSKKYYRSNEAYKRWTLIAVILRFSMGCELLGNKMFIVNFYEK